MNKKTLIVFRALMKKGWIERQNDQTAWNYSLEQQVIEDLELFQEEFEFELHRVRDRLYMVPTQDNDLFLKNNDDFKRDIGGSDARNRDIYLMNFIAVYLLYLFFNTEVSGNLSRNMISEEDFISELNRYFSIYEKSDKSSNDIQSYSENFSILCNDWLTKTEGDSTSKRLNDKYGIVNKLLIKLKTDDIFAIDENRIIKPTQKCKDLMPHFLKKDRIIDIHNRLREEENNAKTE